MKVEIFLLLGNMKDAHLFLNDFWFELCHWIKIVMDLIFTLVCVCMHVQLLQSCLTLWNPVDYSPPDCSVYGLFQARLLEWVSISSSGGSSWPRDGFCRLLHCRQILYCLSPWGSLFTLIVYFNVKKINSKTMIKGNCKHLL